MSSVAIVAISVGVIALVLIMANSRRRSAKDRGGDGSPYGGNGRSGDDRPDGDAAGGDGGGGDGGGGD